MTTEFTVYHYDNRDRQLGVLHDLQTCYRDWDLEKSEDLLTLHATDAIDKEDRLVVRGRDGGWLEYVVTSPQDDDGGTGTTIVAELSSTELGGHYIDELRPTGGCAELLAKALEGTRWQSDGSDIDDPAVTQVWYHTNSLAAVNRIASTFGGEVRYRFEVEGSKVTGRHVGVFKRLGSDKGRVFEYGRDLLGVARECTPDPIYTRVYGYGSGVEVTDDEGQATGGYTRKITFADINGGKPYVESAEALERWGIPDGHGGVAHCEGKVEFDDCEDPAELLRLTTEWAEAQWQPRWSYTVDVLALDGEPLGKGDDCTVYDEAYTPALTIRERVIKGHEDYLQPEADEYTLGRVQPVVSDTLAEQQQVQQELGDRTEGLETQSERWDESADNTEHMPGEWLQQMMGRLNQEFEAGGSHKFESFEKGTIYSSVPLDETGRPTRTPATALQLTSLGFRIASTTDASGNFVWTTFGTGEGFTANVINVGKLTAGDNYIDLDHGEVHLSAGSTDVGSKSLQSYVQGEAGDIADQAIEDAMTQEKVFMALTNGGQTQGIYLSGGKVYINASYIQSGTISANLVKAGVLADQNGNVAINLNTGHATLKDIEASGSFTCGTASDGMRLTSDGKLAGYKGGRQVGYIDYSGEVQDTQGYNYSGLLVSGGTVGFDVDQVYVRDSSGESYRMTSGDANYVVVRNVMQAEDKTITLVTGDIMVGFINGFCAFFDVW